jgi:hypothetical protein
MFTLWGHPMPVDISAKTLCLDKIDGHQQKVSEAKANLSLMGTSSSHGKHTKNPLR